MSKPKHPELEAALSYNEERCGGTGRRFVSGKLIKQDCPGCSDCRREITERAQQVIEDLEGYGEQILTQQAVTVIAEALREAEARGRADRDDWMKACKSMQQGRDYYLDRYIKERQENERLHRVISDLEQRRVGLLNLMGRLRRRTMRYRLELRDCAESLQPKEDE